MKGITYESNIFCIYFINIKSISFYFSNTSPNGRCVDLVDNMKVNFTAGRYKIHFDVDKYFTLRRIETMYPFIEIVFDVKNPAGHYHIPVLLSPFGYTTYRGSERWILIKSSYLLDILFLCKNIKLRKNKYFLRFQVQTKTNTSIVFSRILCD